MDINQAYRLEILSRMRSAKDIIGKPGWGKTWTYQMIKDGKFEFKLANAVSAAEAVGASHADVFLSAVIRVRASEFHVGQVWKSTKGYQYLVLSRNDDNRVVLQNTDGSRKIKRDYDAVENWVLIYDPMRGANK